MRQAIKPSRTRRRRCLWCGELFTPDPRTKGRQRYCSKPECQTKRQRLNEAAWRIKNPDCLDYQREQSRHWYIAHPDYSRKRVRRILDGPLEASSIPKISILDGYGNLVAEWYKQYPRLKATQVYERLIEYGYKGAYASVARFTREHRAPKKGDWTTMTQICQMWNELRFVSDCSSLTEEQVKAVMPILKDELQAREVKRIRYLLQRSEIASTIVTTNLIPSQWGKIFEAATATATLDRLSLNGKFITCEGRSYRSKK